MIKLETELEGKKALYGEVSEILRNHGFDIGGNWDFEQGMFDKPLSAGEDGETIYLRLPFDVVDGEMDNDNALLVFRTPFVLKHVEDVEVDGEDSAVLTTSGLEQFRSPADKDAPIQHKSSWAESGEQEVARVVNDLV
ncbi:YugN family protein [Mesobacillus foraminis]|uniref:YugN family protein n=1 Tax=Mesobacillus foraminis TaxID=279826 RepID=UPI000EF50F9E|nr:YugN family protein [Mesobacillus foraminis]